MTTSEKVAYLKGLLEGFELDADKKETKLFKTIVDILADIAMDVESLEENALDLAEEIDELSDDLAVLESELYDDDEDEDEDDEDDEDDEEEDGDGCGCGCCGDDEPMFFEIKCPACENEITIDEDVLELGSIDCPNCGGKLEFDLSDADEED